MDGLIKKLFESNVSGRPNRGSQTACSPLSFPRNCIFISTHCKV